MDAPIRRHLNNEKKHKKRIHRPRLTMMHKQKGLEYARQYQTMSAKEWRKFVFSDEKKFNLDGLDDFQKYWNAKEFPEENYSRHSGGGSLMIRGDSHLQENLNYNSLCEDAKWFISHTRKVLSMWRRRHFFGNPQCINYKVLDWIKSKTSWSPSVLSRPQSNRIFCRDRLLQKFMKGVDSTQKHLNSKTHS